MAKVKMYKSKAWLQRKLYRERKTPEEIAKDAKCQPSTIYNWMKKHGLRKP